MSYLTPGWHPKYKESKIYRRAKRVSSRKPEVSPFEKQKRPLKEVIFKTLNVVLVFSLIAQLYSFLLH